MQGSDKVLAHAVGRFECSTYVRRFAEAYVILAPLNQRPTIRRQIFRFVT